MWEYLKLTCSAFGDPEQGGRLETYGQFIERVPIPTASATAINMLSTLAKTVHQMHSKRRERVERFLRICGQDPATSGSRNPLEQPWTITPKEFSRRVMNGEIDLFLEAHDETAVLTEEIKKLEHKINEHVAALYGL